MSVPPQYNALKIMPLKNEHVACQWSVWIDLAKGKRRLEGKKMLSGNLAGGRQREGNCCIPWIGGDAPQKSQDIDLSTCLIPTP